MSGGPAGHIPLGEVVTNAPADGIQRLAPALPLPASAGDLPPGDYRLVLSIRAESGALLSENSYELMVVDIGNFKPVT